MLTTKLDLEIYDNAKAIKEKMIELMNEMFGSNFRSFDEENLNSTFIMILEELQKIE